MYNIRGQSGEILTGLFYLLILVLGFFLLISFQKEILSVKVENMEKMNKYELAEEVYLYSKKCHGDPVSLQLEPSCEIETSSSLV